MTTTIRITITTATGRRQSVHRQLAAPNGHAAVELVRLAAAPVEVTLPLLRRQVVLHQ